MATIRSSVVLCIAFSVLNNNQVWGCCYCRRLAEKISIETNDANSTVGRRLDKTHLGFVSIGEVRKSLTYFGTTAGGKCTRNSNCVSGICRHSVCLKTRVGTGCEVGDLHGNCLKCGSDYVMQIVHDKSKSTQYKYCQICPAGTPRNKCITGTSSK